jgi:hypothetical protein
MEWLQVFFINYSDTFYYLGTWAVVIFAGTLLLVHFASRSSKMYLTTSAPLLDDVCLPMIATKPNAPVTYVACEKCGHHALKKGREIECLSSVCRLNKK